MSGATSEYPRSRTIRRRAESLANDERILDGAVTLTAGRGVDGVSVVELARAAGLTTGAVYARYTDLPELLADLWVRRCADLVDGLIAAADRDRYDGIASLLAGAGGPGHATIVSCRSVHRAFNVGICALEETVGGLAPIDWRPFQGALQAGALAAAGIPATTWIRARKRRLTDGPTWAAHGPCQTDRMADARSAPARPMAASDLDRRLLIVEDQALLRDLLAGAFTQRGFRVATAGSAADAARVARTFDPDGALLDIDLGEGPDGVEVAHALLRRFPYLAIAFLTDSVDPRVAHAAPLPSGATVAYLGKTGLTDLDRLFDAVDAALTDASGARYRDDARADASFAELTDPQLQVLALAAGGCSNLVIAEIRGTTERSVERILAGAYTALGIDPGPRTNQRVAAVTRFLAAGGRALVPGPAGDGRGHG